MSPVPLIVGLALWAGATLLLMDDVLHSGHFTLTHALQPLLTAGTVCAAVICHHRLASWRLVSGTVFLAIALLGSLTTIYGTLSRTATARDLQQAGAMAENRTLAERDAALRDAKAGVERECKVIGPRCLQWQARVDSLTREMAPLRAVSVDPRADALARLATLFGGNGQRVRAIVAACDPIVLPLFLELGCIVFFSAAFPRRKRHQVSTLAGNSFATVTRAFTRDEALADFRTMREVGAQQLLAQRWGRDEGTVSRWLQSWQASGEVQRQRVGRQKSAQVLRLAHRR